jgi:hypothetical protein
MKREPRVDVKRLEKLIQDRGLEIGQVGYLAGVDYNTLYKIRNHNRPRTSAEIVGRLAQALNCSTDYLIGLTDNPLPYSSQPMGSFAQELLMVSGRLSAKRQRELLIIANSLVQAELEDQERLKRNSSTNKKLFDFIEGLFGQEGLRDALDSLGFSEADSSRLLDMVRPDELSGDTPPNDITDDEDTSSDDPLDDEGKK